MEIFVTIGCGQPNGTGFIKVIGPNWAICRNVVHQLTKGRFCVDYDSIEGVHPFDQHHLCTIEASMDETQPKINSIYDVHCCLPVFEGWTPDMFDLVKRKEKV